MNLLWHEPGRMAYERFHAVYVQCFCGSICIYIYIWARFMVLYLIHYFSGGPEKHARPYIYIYYMCINHLQRSPCSIQKGCPPVLLTVGPRSARYPHLGFSWSTSRARWAIAKRWTWPNPHVGWTTEQNVRWSTGHIMWIVCIGL